MCFTWYRRLKAALRKIKTMHVFNKRDELTPTVHHSTVGHPRPRHHLRRCHINAVTSHRLIYRDCCMRVSTTAFKSTPLP